MKNSGLQSVREITEAQEWICGLKDISGLSIEYIEEMYPEFGTYWFESSGGRNDLTKEELKKLYDWKTNPLAALPAWLSVCSRKR